MSALQALEQLTDQALASKAHVDAVRAWEGAIRVCEELGIVGGRPYLEIPPQVRKEFSGTTSWTEGTHPFTRLCFQCSRLVKAGLYLDDHAYGLSRQVLENMACWFIPCL